MLAGGGGFGERREGWGEAARREGMLGWETDLQAAEGHVRDGGHARGGGVYGSR